MLITMLAQNYGIRPRVYARTRTLVEFHLDVRAFLARYTVPMRLVFGSLTGGGPEQKTSANGPRPSTAASPYGWYRRAHGRKYNVWDLGTQMAPEELDVQRHSENRKALFDALGSSVGRANAPLWRGQTAGSGA